MIVMPEAACATAEFGPWNPGIASEVPERLRPLCTIFRPENTFTEYAKAAELRDLTGLDLADLVAFRPERLALHELLIRVTADFSVPDGTKIEDLGINFREIVRTIKARHIEPEMDAIVARYDMLKRQISGVVAAELSRLYPSAAQSVATTPPSRLGGLRRFFGRRHAHADPIATDPDREQRLIAEWEQTALATRDARSAACAALSTVVSALLVRHGRLWGSREMIAALATDIASNVLGSETIGCLLDPLLAKAVADDGFVLLPPQEQPVVMNTKGPSASGKSTLRPLQKRARGRHRRRLERIRAHQPGHLAQAAARLRHARRRVQIRRRVYRRGVEDHRSEARSLRGAQGRAWGHLASADRPVSLRQLRARLRRSGQQPSDSLRPHVYLFFMVTPPASLVERAWQRGLDVGRYKAVDDTLAHAVEAYSGMPQLFFTWVERADKRVHFEFLDNSVAQGERPRTIAFGWNDMLNVLDVKGMLDIERYRRIDVGATAPELLYADADLGPDKNSGFLRECVARIRRVDFADQATGRVYLRLESGNPIWADGAVLREVTANADTFAGLRAVAPAMLDRALPEPDTPTFLNDDGRERTHTLGSWGQR